MTLGIVPFSGLRISAVQMIYTSTCVTNTHDLQRQDQLLSASFWHSHASEGSPGVVLSHYLSGPIREASLKALLHCRAYRTR